MNKKTQQQQDVEPRYQSTSKGTSAVSLDHTNTSFIEGIIQHNLPGWLQTYLSWHKSKRAELAEMDKSGAKYNMAEMYNRTKDFRFLAVVCLHPMKCNGMADRMKSYPYWLLKANQTNRILLFHWNKDNLFLSDYLVPPQGGMDWVVPSEKSSVLYKILHKEGSCLNNGSINHYDKQENKQLACVRAHMFPTISLQMISDSIRIAMARIVTHMPSTLCSSHRKLWQITLKTKRA